MIFVTVGTHEQGFDRLVRHIDLLKGSESIKEEVFLQIGYTKYKPKFCKYQNMLTNDEMNEYSKTASIVITQGGPGSIMLPFTYGKIPIVVPRQSEFLEHVDNHQVKFTKKLEEQGKILAVYEIELLEDKILNYEEYVARLSMDYKANTKQFVKRLEHICLNLIARNT